LAVILFRKPKLAWSHMQIVMSELLVAIWLIGSK